MSKLLNWGNALGLRIPKSVYRVLGWDSGTIVKVKVGKGNSAIVHLAPDTLADERTTLAANIMVRDSATKKAKPYVTSLKRLEASYVKSYDDIKERMAALPAGHKDMPMLRQVIAYLEGDIYSKINHFIDQLEEKEPTE